MHIYSLRRRLLKRLLWPLIPILLLGAIFAYLFALHAAMNAYDLGLMNEALDLSQQVRIQQDRLVIDLPLVAQQMLQSNNEDLESYAIWDDTGALIAGSPAVLQAALPHLDGDSLFYDITLDGKQNRAIVLRQQYAGKPYFISVSQTIRGRIKLTNSTFVGILLPEALLALVSISVVLWGVRRGLLPVNTLRNEISARSSNDLRPIDETSAPEELTPIIHGINELLVNLASALASHRRFIADAAHQLRTPLASLSSQIEVGLEDTPQDIKAFLRQLLATTQRTTHLSNQLLSLARLEHTEQLMREVIATDLRQIVLDTSADFVSSGARKGVDFNFDLHAAQLIGSPLMLRELLTNLLDNAVRYTPAGGQIDVALHTEGNGILLSVENNGVDVPESALQKLGTPFHSTLQGQTQGCGLGLAIVMEIARLHDARVSFNQRDQGDGLVVRVFFPAGSADRPAQTTTAL